MPTLVPINPRILVNGVEMQTEHYDTLIEIRVEAEMRLPGRVTLRFRDPDNKLAKSRTFDLGNKLEVRVKTPDTSSAVMLIDATITGVGYETTAGSSATDRFDGRRGSIDEFFVVGHDNAYQLTRNCTVKGLAQITPGDLVS